MAAREERERERERETAQNGTCCFHFCKAPSDGPSGPNKEPHQCAFAGPRHRSETRQYCTIATSVFIIRHATAARCWHTHPQPSYSGSPNLFSLHAQPHPYPAALCVCLLPLCAACLDTMRWGNHKEYLLLQSGRNQACDTSRPPCLSLSR